MTIVQALKEIRQYKAKVADKVSPETEGCLLELVDEIQLQLLSPEKSTSKQICQEVAEWQQQASGPSKDG